MEAVHMKHKFIGTNCRFFSARPRTTERQTCNKPGALFLGLFPASGSK